MVFWMRAETRGRERSGGLRPPERTPAACCENPLRASDASSRRLETELELPGRPEKPFGRSPERALRAKLDGVVVFSGGAVVGEHTMCEPTRDPKDSFARILLLRGWGPAFS